MERLTLEAPPFDDTPQDGSHDWTTVYCAKCGYDHKIIKTCSFRFCPICSRIRAARIRRRLAYLVDNYPPPPGMNLKMITLSVKNCQDLPGGIKHLVASFRRLRQTRHWKFHVSGGATIVEITGKKGNWHPHLHILCYSSYYPFALLLKQWKESSGGSAVWISPISKAKGLSYVTKYITKFQGFGADALHVSECIKQCRLFQRFGLWHDFVLPRLKFDNPCPLCHSCDWISDWEIEKQFRKIRPG